ncbi:aspartyl/asparaginyl beta-hydroxylase domain-containing protein [Streptomyces sp. SCSIO 30461]|uniref:aspartyl/asparaginyl beta-hydroxylase domain-containing protein n=1 Tax=Streptomyces sp. SCSIO 30461 TaxID=3118085 RepID=UPI0030CDB638
MRMPRIYDCQGRSLPNSVELGQAGDPGQLRAELAALRAAGAPLAAREGRRVLALHSPGGDHERTDPGGPGLHGFAATRWLAHTPLLAGVLRSLPATLRSVRLLALAPGAVFTKLQVAKNGPPWGLCRLHLPLVSSPGSQVVFADGNSKWQPGSLWFVASWRQHALVNGTDEELVHAVIDLHHTASLANLFPSDLQFSLLGPAALERSPVAPLGPDELRRFSCRFPLPETFINWEQPGHFLPRSAMRHVVPAEIVPYRGELRLMVAGHPFCTLEHLGHGEFRMCGWSEERTLQVREGTGGPATVVAQAREGANSYTTTLPAAVA